MHSSSYMGGWMLKNGNENPCCYISKMDVPGTTKAAIKTLSSTKAFGCSISRYQHVSTSLNNLPAKFSIISPPSSPHAQSALLIWLSGLTCTDENFVAKSGAAAHALKYNIHIACPDTSPRGAQAPNEDQSWDFGTGAGFYVDATEEGYEAYQMRSYVTSEFIPLVKNFLNIDSKVAISGHSMGGMGALAIAFNFPQLFTSCSAFAPIVHPAVVPWGAKCFARYLGDDKTKWNEYDPCEVLKKVGSKFHNVLIDQGVDDTFLEEQLKVHEFQSVCEDVGQKVSVNMAEGYDHSYFFVQTFLEKHIRFHALNLGCWNGKD